MSSPKRPVAENSMPNFINLSHNYDYVLHKIAELLGDMNKNMDYLRESIEDNTEHLKQLNSYYENANVEVEENVDEETAPAA